MESLKESLMSRVKKSSDITDIKNSIDKAEEFTLNEIKQKAFQSGRTALMECISIKNDTVFIDYLNKSGQITHKSVIINIEELFRNRIFRIECINVPKNDNYIGDWYQIYLKYPHVYNTNKKLIIGSSGGGIRLDYGDNVDNYIDIEGYNIIVSRKNSNNIFTLGYGFNNSNELFGSNMANQIYRVCTEKYKRPKDLDDLDTILRCKESVDILFKDLKSKNLTNTFLCDKNYNWFDKMVGFAVCDDQKMVRQIKIQYYDFWSKANEYNFDNNITTLVFKNYDLDKYKGIPHK